MEIKRFEVSSLSAKILLETATFFSKTFSLISSLASDPLFSTFVALYSLILLYFPRSFLDLVFSPVLISTGILLSTLLRLGAVQRDEKEEISTEPEEINSPDEAHKWVRFETDTETEFGTETEMGFYPETIFSNSFVEWNVRAPLEVIYEEYEGEEEEEEEDLNGKEEFREVGFERLVSLSLFYPESDSCSSSENDFPGIIQGWDSPENMCFMWDEEDREGLIEIALDGKKNSVFQVEEENLIEIEISPIGASPGGKR